MWIIVVFAAEPVNAGRGQLRSAADEHCRLCEYNVVSAQFIIAFYVGVLAS